MGALPFFFLLPERLRNAERLSFRVSSLLRCRIVPYAERGVIAVVVAVIL
jgi:hypothetical protein